MTSCPLSTTLDELNALCRFFTEAGKRLEKGEITDLSGIDLRVSAVCKTVENALPEQQNDYLPLLTSLIGLLNGYEKSLCFMQESHEASSVKEMGQHAGR